MARDKRTPRPRGDATGAKGLPYDWLGNPTLLTLQTQFLTARYGLGIEAAAMVAALAFGGGSHGY